MLKTKTMGMLTSSSPSPDMEKRGLFVDVLPLLESTTMPPLAPAFSKTRAFSRKKVRVSREAFEFF